MEKLLFVYNPHAGMGKVRGKLAEIVEAFSYHGFLPTVSPTHGAGDATRIVRELGEQFSRVVCCGGDGTLHEVVAGLMELPDPPVLGYIPAGSTNDFSRNLNLPLDMALAASVAVTGPAVRCDMGRFNGAPFVYVAAFGTLADVSYDTPQNFKNMFGHLAYILEGIGRLGAVRSWPVRVEYDGGVIEDEFILGMVSNTRSVGGFKWGSPKTVRLDDGRFEVVLVRPPKTPADLHRILSAVITQNPVEGGPLIGFTASHVTFQTAEPLAWSLDGEFGGKHKTADVQNVQKALALCHRPRS